MSPEMLLVFVPACFALNMAPGPNNLLSVSNASRFGFAAACMAGIGRLAAFVGMIAIAASGLAVILQASALAFTVVKVIGALYLFYLAIQLWRAPVAGLQVSTTAGSMRLASLWRLTRQEFMVAAGNPKAILIFTAFLPQFVNPAEAAAPQFVILGSFFLVLEWVAIAAYAYMGSHLGKWFAVPARERLFNRACASLLGFAGGGLLLSKKAAGAA
ncbi:LysE family translocator [Pseudothauera nasutitermitis]|uniref:LysE family translocator n=1 Tax=Pseudothauera nasutitermitis TaxID=2565930 RepID=A0A4S4AZR3_9RHOO|nr:LysE family translocator [Pseudothauera nasutitermitis]THF65651.1 LysE family translocator [Pseudothauera nasutitermitis]